MPEEGTDACWAGVTAKGETNALLEEEEEEDVDGSKDGGNMGKRYSDGTNIADST